MDEFDVASQTAGTNTLPPPPSTPPDEFDLAPTHADEFDAGAFEAAKQTAGKVATPEVAVGMLANIDPKLPKDQIRQQLAEGMRAQGYEWFMDPDGNGVPLKGDYNPVTKNPSPDPLTGPERADDGSLQWAIEHAQRSAKEMQQADTKMSQAMLKVHDTGATSETGGDPQVGDAQTRTSGGALLQAAYEATNSQLEGLPFQSDVDQITRDRLSQRDTLRQVIEKAGGFDQAASGRHGALLTTIAHNMLLGQRQSMSGLFENLEKRVASDGVVESFAHNLGQALGAIPNSLASSVAAISDMAGGKGSRFLQLQQQVSMEDSLDAASHYWAGLSGQGVGMAMDMYSGPGNFAAMGMNKLTGRLLNPVIGQAQRSAFRALLDGTPLSRVLTSNIPDNVIRGGINFGTIQALPALLQGDLQKAGEEFRSGAILGAVFHTMNAGAHGDTFEDFMRRQRDWESRSDGPTGEAQDPADWAKAAPPAGQGPPRPDFEGGTKQVWKSWQSWAGQADGETLANTRDWLQESPEQTTQHKIARQLVEEELNRREGARQTAQAAEQDPGVPPAAGEATTTPPAEPGGPLAAPETPSEPTEKEVRQTEAEVLKEQASKLRETLAESHAKGEATAVEMKAQSATLDEMIKTTNDLLDRYKGRYPLTAGQKPPSQEELDNAVSEQSPGRGRGRSEEVPAKTGGQETAAKTPPQKENAPVGGLLTPSPDDSAKVTRWAADAANKLGIVFDGVQVDANEKPSSLQFTIPDAGRPHPKTGKMQGTSINVAQGDDLEARVKEKRDQFKAKPKGNPFEEGMKAREAVKAAVAKLPEGTVIHGTDLESLPKIAEDGLQPGNTYHQGGSSDESVVYGSKVKGGDAGVAGSYAGRRPGSTPVILQFKPGVEYKPTGPGAGAINSKGKSYVHWGDVEAVHVGGKVVTPADALRMAFAAKPEPVPPEVQEREAFEDKSGENVSSAGTIAPADSSQGETHGSVQPAGDTGGPGETQSDGGADVEQAPREPAHELGAVGEKGMGEEQSDIRTPAGQSGGSGAAGQGGSGGTGAGEGLVRDADRIEHEPTRSPAGSSEASHPGVRPGSPGAGPGPEPNAAGNHRMSAEMTRPGGEITRMRDNLAAIRLTKEILSQDRSATPDEQAIIARFSGWGALGNIFNWQAREKSVLAMGTEIKNLLSEDEYDAAKRSIQNAHYTDGRIVAAMWQGLQAMGFVGGRVLEPSMGMGYFFGLMPAMDRESALVGVELDHMTGQMAKLLYPDAKVHVNAYQRVPLPEGYFDVAISNVPFADTRIMEDPAYNKMSPRVHDYFFLKALDHVRPGGIVAFITSKGTMDKAGHEGEAIRRAIARKAELVAAVRLPGGAHEEQADTQVVTDVILLRKLADGQTHQGPTWIESKPLEGTEFFINEYFQNNPGMVLGTHAETGRMYSAKSYNVEAAEGWMEKFGAIMRGLPAGTYSPMARSSKAFEPQVIDAPGTTKEGGLAVVDGKLYLRNGGNLVEQKAGKEAISRAQGMLGIRDALRQLFTHELAGQKQQAEAERENLNNLYDAFVKKYGTLHDKRNTRIFQEDPDQPILLALENKSKKNAITKADVFTKSTLRPHIKVEKADDLAQAVGIVLNESARIDMDRLVQLTGRKPTDIEAELVEKALAYKDPADGWTPGDIYLSGNVKKRLQEARAAADLDQQYLPNVEALEKVQPADVPAVDIDARMGAAWISSEDHHQFVNDLAGTQTAISIFRNPETGGWIVNGRDHTLSSPSLGRYYTPRLSFAQIMQAALNSRPPIVYDTVEKDKKVVNAAETEKGALAMENVRDAFADWIWKDDARRDRLARHYNDTFNTHRNIAYNGSHLTFPGMNPMIQLRSWQVNGVWMQLVRGRGLMAHEVGTGKTFMEGAAAMEMKRLGLANKPAIAVPKDLIEQTTREIQALYPSARILSTSGRFESGQRRRTVSMISTGDWDLVLLTHEHLNYLTMKPEAVEAFIKEEQDEIEAVISAMKADRAMDKRSIKQMENTKDKVEQRWLGLLSRAKKDNAVFFEETGIDHLFVDEAHAYKALPVYTQHRNVKGIPTGSSDRAKLLFMKARYLYGVRGNKGLSMLTGTPITNTMAELYNFQRYLQFEEMKQLGIHAFDGWASTFGQVSTKMEFTHAGQVKDVTSFSSFINLPELRKIVGADMDVVRSPKELARPKKQIIPFELTETPTQRLYRLLTILRVSRVVKRPGPGDDMHLLIAGDGAKAAIDPRLVLPGAPDDPGSKLNRLVENVLKVYNERPDRMQFIFSDTGVWPTSWGFSAYQDIIDKLVAGGIPRERIVDARNFVGDKAKRLRQLATEQANAGEIAVILGSTKKVGTGLNAQRYTIALHHLDAPYLPGDIEQRDGRGHRQGNLLHEEGLALRVFHYLTEKSADAFRWQLVTRKSKFIHEFQDGSLKTRTVGEDDLASMSPDQLMALASGNPKLMEKIQLEADVKKMVMAKRFHEQALYDQRSRIKFLQTEIPKVTRFLQATRENYDAMMQLTAPTRDENPGKVDVTIDGKHFTSVEQAGAAVQNALDRHTSRELINAPGHVREIGEWGPVKLYAAWSRNNYEGVDLLVKPNGPVGSYTIDSYATRTQDPAKQLSAISTAILRGTKPDMSLPNHIKEMERQLAQGTADQPFPREAELASGKDRLEKLHAEVKGVKQGMDLLADLTEHEKSILESWYDDRIARIGKAADSETIGAESGDEDEMDEQQITPTEMSPLEKRDAIIADGIVHKGEGPPGALQSGTIPKSAGKPPAGGGKIIVGLTTAVQGAIESASKALDFFANAGRNMRERFNKYQEDFGAKEGKPLIDAMVGYITARDTGRSMGEDLAKRTLKGLSEEQADHLIAYKLDGYRRAVNWAFATKMAHQITPADINELEVTRAIFDSLNDMDAVHPGDLAQKLTHNLSDVDPSVLDGWISLMAGDITYSPEAMAEKEMRNATDYYKADDQTRGDWEDDKELMAANDFWETNVAPWIDGIRVRRRLPMNGWFKHYNAINFVTDTFNDLFPRQATPGVSQFDRFKYPGERKRFIGPASEYLMKVVQGHYRTDRETDLFDLLQKIAVPEDVTDVKPDGTRVAKVLGKHDVPVSAFDVEPSDRRIDNRFLPSELVEDLNQIEAPKPLKSRAIVETAKNFFIGLKLMGAAPQHAYRLLFNTSRKMMSKHPSAMPVVARLFASFGKTPYLAMRDIMGQLNEPTNHAEALQELLERIGAAGRRAATAQSLLGRAWTYGDKVLFDRAIGVDNVARRHLLETLLRARLGDKIIDADRKMVEDGSVLPAELASVYASRLGEEGRVDVARAVNNLMGWTDKNVRSPWMNKWQVILPYIASESGTIPSELASLMTANVDWTAAVNAAKAGNHKLAGRILAAGLLTGVLGIYALMNLLNYTFTGHGMWGNDSGHELDVQFGDHKVYFGLDSGLQRAARLLPIKPAIKEGEFGTAAVAADTARNWWNEIVSVVDPAMDLMARELLGKTLHVDQDNAILPASRLSGVPTPFVQNTARAAESGKPILPGILKDLNSDFIGAPFTSDTRSVDQVRRDAYELAVRRSALIMAQPPSAARDTQINQFLTALASQPVEGQPLDARQVYRDAMIDAKRPLISALVAAVRQHDATGYAKAMRDLQNAGLPTHQLMKYLVERKFLSADEIQGFEARSADKKGVTP